MFSYLHGIRPSNRRSAVPSAAAPLRGTSQSYHHDAAIPAPPSSFGTGPSSPRPPQSYRLNETSPVSPDPPVLPPIPRVASQNELPMEVIQEPLGQKNDFIQTATRRRPPLDVPLKSLSYAQGIEQQPSIAVTDCNSGVLISGESSMPSRTSEQPQATQGRRKRPIDMAYESMRAYTEPPRGSTFGRTPENALFLPQPSRLPPPPPSDSSRPQRPQQTTPPPARNQAQAPPTASQKGHGKAKLNLLNPISLLARRRSSQAVEEAYSQSQSTPRLPDDFDPRIRGKVVHDFSAPRPSRPVSSNEPTNEFEGLSEAKWKRRSPNRRSATEQEEHSPSSTEKEHTPVFKEHFDDNVESWSVDMDSPAKRRSSAFMYQVSLQTSQPPDPSFLPAFARNLPSNLSNEIDALRKTSSPPPKSHLEILLEPPTADQISAKSSPPTSPPPKTRSRATSVNDSSFQTPGSPQRFRSNASRFSFDLAGVGSAAQEKLLEEKHRQKTERQQRESVLSNENDVDDDDNDDGYAYYDEMDDDGLEEQIPGVNADAETSDIPVLQHGIENIQFISPNKSSFESATSAVSTGLTSPATPRDLQGRSLTSKSSPDLVSQLGDHQILSNESTSLPISTSNGAIDPDSDALPLQQEFNSETNLAGLPYQHNYQDDDMYFDDGIIEDINDDELQPFDESVFDDDTSRIYGLPLRDLKSLPQSLDHGHSPDDQPLQTDQLTSQTFNPQDYDENAKSPPGLLDENATVDGVRDSTAVMNEPLNATSTSNITALTQDKLGLHNQLAYAANQAALQGRFNRAYSQSSTHESLDNPTSSLGTATQDNQVLSHNDGLLISKDGDENDDFAYDDVDMAFTEAEDDDPIIAAANAEALENDDDGFYGQEFGFFARKPGSSDAEFTNGGYFGAHAFESIHRMNSGRDNFLEPSLTPITERSEWSNRNSMVSLAMHGYPLSSQYQSNPQLADLMRVQEGEEMSLEALQKLRHSTWGGSTNSLQSSSNSQNGGSPLTYLPPGMVAPFMQATNSNGSLMSPTGQTLAGSYHSFSSGGQASSNDSNPSPSAESPTITISPSESNLVTQMQPPPPPMGPPPPPPTNSSPVKRGAVNVKPWAPGHSRTSSGAESVSYREENGKWFCEKTRVIEETGEVEVLGRSVIEGGRI